MDLFVIVIIIASTGMHAGWNLLARYTRSEGEFYRRMLTITLLVGFIPALISEILTGSMTPFAWVCVTGSGICAAIYLFGLAKAFEVSDFTIVYPIARALPVIFIGVIDVMRGRTLTPAGWMGIFLVVVGSALVPQNKFTDIRISNYLNRAVFWMLVAALGTVGYTILDKLAAEVVQSGADTAARYAYFYFAISFFPYIVLIRNVESTQGGNKKMGWILPAIGALFGFSAYWLILWAYQLNPQASYIVAFRQFSIVISAAIAFLVFKEPGFKIRMSGAILITLGLVFIGLWGK